MSTRVAFEHRDGLAVNGEIQHDQVGIHSAHSGKPVVVVGSMCKPHAAAFYARDDFNNARVIVEK